ncbi:MAG: hypothetical protein J6S29_00095 [Methanosphaera sp.]|nr:hypothetical protein [Methanosphaera sp.]
MREQFLMIIGICVILGIIAASSAFLFSGNDNRTNDTDNTTPSNNSTNVSLNESNNTTNNTTTQSTTKTTTKTSSKKSSGKSGSQSSDPDYDPERDASHKTATVDKPITVQQSDGEYTYYGSGHYDYYAGPTHMSGEHYKYMNSRSQP